MKINTITVSAGRTFNHPHEQYSNLRPEVVLTATLTDGDDAAECSKRLQAQAEQLVEDHKQGLLKSLVELYQLNEHQSEVRGLERQLTDAQERLDAIRKMEPQSCPPPSWRGTGILCFGAQRQQPCCQCRDANGAQVRREENRR